MGAFAEVTCTRLPARSLSSPSVDPISVRGAPRNAHVILFRRPFHWDARDANRYFAARTSLLALLSAEPLVLNLFYQPSLAIIYSSHLLHAAFVYKNHFLLHTSRSVSYISHSPPIGVLLYCVATRLPLCIFLPLSSTGIPLSSF